MKDRQPLVSTPRLIARAQILLSVLFMLGVFCVIILYEIRGVRHLSPDELKQFGEWSHWLRDAALLMIAFWFQRLRGNGAADETPASVTQTRTSPDGTQTTITSPAHLPIPSITETPTQPPQAAAK